MNFHWISEPLTDFSECSDLQLLMDIDGNGMISFVFLFAVFRFANNIFVSTSLHSCTCVEVSRESQPRVLLSGNENAYCIICRSPPETVIFKHFGLKEQLVTVECRRHFFTVGSWRDEKTTFIVTALDTCQRQPSQLNKSTGENESVLETMAHRYAISAHSGRSMKLARNS